MKEQEIMNCQRCHSEVKRNTKIQKYCSRCSGIVNREANARARIKKRKELVKA